MKKKSISVGDMNLSFDQYQYLYSGDVNKQSGLSRASDPWPNGSVPIKFGDGINDARRKQIESAMSYISNLSCVTWDFKPKVGMNFVKIINGSGCTSSVGNLKQGEQDLTLSPRCGWGNIVHELLHTLGFYHMHTSIERDKFVNINYSNIQPDSVKLFDKYTAYVSMFDTSYDYG